MTTQYSNELQKGKNNPFCCRGHFILPLTVIISRIRREVLILTLMQETIQM